MSWEGWALVAIVAGGLIGGLILWTIHGSRGGHDT